MRKVASVVVVIAAAAASADAKPCPKAEIEKQLPKLNKDIAASGLTPTITGCVEGKFAGPGWIAYYTLSNPKAARPDDGGVVFVKTDGTIGTLYFGDGEGSSKADASAVDLDGDGVDEVVAMISTTGEGSGQKLLVSRVKGDKIEQLLSKGFGDGGGGLTCTTKMSIETRGKTKVVVLTASQKGKMTQQGPWGSECALSPGKHVFAMANGKVEEAAK
jgi:hypothetical protein